MVACVRSGLYFLQNGYAHLLKAAVGNIFTEGPSIYFGSGQISIWSQVGRVAYI